MVTTPSPENAPVLITVRVTRAEQGRPAADGAVFTAASALSHTSPTPAPTPRPHPASEDVGLCQEAELDRTAGAPGELPAFV